MVDVQVGEGDAGDPFDVGTEKLGNAAVDLGCAGSHGEFDQARELGSGGAIHAGVDHEELAAGPLDEKHVVAGATVRPPLARGVEIANADGPVLDGQERAQLCFARQRRFDPLRLQVRWNQQHAGQQYHDHDEAHHDLQKQAHADPII